MSHTRVCRMHGCDLGRRQQPFQPTQLVVDPERDVSRSEGLGGRTGLKSSLAVCDEGAVAPLDVDRPLE